MGRSWCSRPYHPTVYALHAILALLSPKRRVGKDTPAEHVFDSTSMRTPATTEIDLNSSCHAMLGDLFFFPGAILVLTRCNEKRDLQLLAE